MLGYNLYYLAVRGFISWNFTYILLVNSNLCLLEPSNLTILSSRFWIKDVVKLSNNFLVLDLGYKVKTLLWWYFS